MRYVLFFLRSLAIGGLAAVLPSVIYEFLKLSDSHTDSDK